jgi:hypothetical protein
MEAKKQEDLAELGELGDVLDAKDLDDPFVSKLGGEPVMTSSFT